MRRLFLSAGVCAAGMLAPLACAFEIELLGTNGGGDPLNCPYLCGEHEGRGICQERVCFCTNGWTGAACQYPLVAAAAVGAELRRAQREQVEAEAARTRDAP